MNKDQGRFLDLNQFTRIDFRLKQQNDLLERIAVALEKQVSSITFVQNNPPVPDRSTDGPAEQV